MSEATDRYERIKAATEWTKDEDGYISFAAGPARDRALIWALNQFSRAEYFAQDILERITQAEMALDLAGQDPDVWGDDSTGMSVRDVLHDAYVAITRLRDPNSTKPGTNQELFLGAP